LIKPDFQAAQIFVASEQHGAHIRLAQHELTAEKPEPKAGNERRAESAASLDWLYSNSLVIAAAAQLHDIERHHGVKNLHNYSSSEFPELTALRDNSGIARILPHKYYLEQPHND
jgi:hypothetical protein